MGFPRTLVIVILCLYCDTNAISNAASRAHLAADAATAYDRSAPARPNPDLGAVANTRRQPFPSRECTCV